MDEHSFCVGNIAPDCNIENSDFTKYIPSREKTHWMSQKHKTDVDYQNNYNDILRDQKFNSKQRLSFLLGYYSHLITDVEFHKLMNDKNQIGKTFQRLKADSNMRTRIEGFPETKSTLKQVFDRWTLLGDIFNYENCYVLDHPDCSYNRILRKTKEFPEYLEMFPKGAIVRKIGIMANEVIETKKYENHFFFTKEEYQQFLNRTCQKIYELLNASGLCFP